MIHNEMLDLFGFTCAETIISHSCSVVYPWFTYCFAMLPNHYTYSYLWFTHDIPLSCHITYSLPILTHDRKFGDLAYGVISQGHRENALLKTCLPSINGDVP